MDAPKLREVRPGIFQIHLPLPMPPSIVNVCLVESDGEWLLIDTGMHSEPSLAAMQVALETAGCPPERLQTIVCTHHHPDHCGASRELRSQTGARLLMHPAEYESTQHFAPRERPAWVSDYFRSIGIPMHLFANVPTPAQFWGSLYQPGEPDDFIEDGQTLHCGRRRIEVVHTPGHTRGHCVLYLPEERVMVVGDHLLPKITPHIGFFAGGPANPLGDFIDSQAKMERFAVDLVLPAHGGTFTDHVRRARQIVQHHRIRLDEILDQIRQRPRTPYDIAARVFDFDVESSLTRQFPATFETMAHLEHLRHGERVTRTEENGLWYYRA